VRAGGADPPAIPTGDPDPADVEIPTAPPEVGPRELGRLARARERAEVAERRARESFEHARTRYMAVQLVTEAFEHDRMRAGGLLAGGLAYRIFLWEIPFALFMVSLFGVATDLAGADPADVAHEAGLTASLAATISQGVAASERGRLWFLLLGAVLTIWAGRGVFRGTRLVSQLAWGARAAPQSSLKGSLVIAGFGLAITTLQTLLPWLFGALDLPGILNFVLAVTAATALFAFGLSLLPRADAPWRAVLPGAILLGVALRLLGLAAATYFAYRLDRKEDLYGALAIAIVLMLYLYLVARLFVAAQFLNATLHRRGAEERLGSWASAVVSDWEQGGDHHPQPGPADDVVGQVGPDVHPPEPDGPDDATQDRPGPTG
jgi:uncharacterized BrkB/YihY/UPF0761 family membrane protein